MRKKLAAAMLAATMLLPANVWSTMAIEGQKNVVMRNVQAATTDEVAYEGKCGKSAKWKFNESTGQLTISGSGKMYDYSYELDLGSGGGPWGAFAKEITSVKIGDKITYVGDGAFVWCKNLTTVKLGKNVEQVGGQKTESPFNACPLENIYIGDKFKGDLSDLLGSRSTIKKIQVSSKNKYFYAKNNLLMNKKKTKLYAIGEPNNRILTIPATVTSIDKNAIVSGNIDEIRVAKGNKKFVVKSGNLYKKSDSSKVIAYPAPLISFAEDSTVTLTTSNFIFGKNNFSFADGEKVKTVVIGKDVTLEQWKQLIKIKSDNTWTCASREQGAFGSTTMAIKEWFPNLESIQVEEGSNDFMVQDDVLYSKDGTMLLYCPNHKTGEFQVPDGVTSLSDGAFFECTELTGISIADSVKTMYANTIKYCEKLEKIEIGNGLAEIKQIGTIIPIDVMDFNFNDEKTNEFLFTKSNALKEITVSSGNAIYSSEDGVLYDKEKTTLLRYPTQRAKEYVMPNMVKKIYDGAFGFFCKFQMYNKYDENPYITNAEMEAHHEYVNEIAKGYEKCKVTAIYLSDGVEDLNTLLLDDVFDECEQCETFHFGSEAKIDIDTIKRLNSICSNIEISEENPNYEIKDGFVYTKKGKGLIGCLKSVSGDITIPGTAEYISSYAFQDCNRITSVTVEEGVKAIYLRAFSGCTNLKSVSLPSTMTEIGDHAFASCDALTSFTIPAGTTTIGTEFLCGENLERIDVQEGNSTFAAQDGILYNKEKTTLYLAPKKLSGTVTIPETVTKICSKAFEGCTQITKFVCGENVTTIEEYAFHECTGLKEIEWNEKLTKIGERAFSGCKNLKSVTFPDSVESIGEYAFSDCTGLESIELPANLTEIEKGVFADGSSLKSVEMPDGLKKIGWWAFSGCTSLKEVKLNEQLTKICMNAFSGCEKLKSIVIPDSVKTIDTKAFAGDTSLKSIVFGKKLKTVGDSAFSGVPKNATIKLPKKKFTALKKILCTSKVGLKSSMTWKKY